MAERVHYEIIAERRMSRVATTLDTFGTRDNFDKIVRLYMVAAKYNN